MWSMSLALACLLGGCGRIGFGDARDALASDEGAIDARIDASFVSRTWIDRGNGTPGVLYAPKLGLVYHATLGVCPPPPP